MTDSRRMGCAPVASYWPEFAAAGKSDVPVRQLLSHQAGLLGVDGGYTDDELLAHTPLAERLAAQRPLWRPGAGFSYHALTIGTLADELVRRIAGGPLREVFHDEIAAPRGIDVHLGTPPELDRRVATVDLPSMEELAAYLARSPFPDRDSLGGMSAPRSEKTQVDGMDLASNMHGRFAVIFQTANPPRMLFGSAQAFGHDGAGGSLGYVDPYYDLAVGYLSKTIHVPVDLDLGPDPRMELTRLIRRCAAAAG